MSEPVALVLLLLLLVGPLAAAPLERNIEFYFLAVGMLATALSWEFSWALAWDALRTPVPIALAVAIAATLFAAARKKLDRMFERLETTVRRSVLTGLSIFLIALVSSLITAIVAALVLVEAVGLLRLTKRARTTVVVSGCFAIGLGSSLSPLGEPLATLAARAMGLPFLGLFHLLGAYVVPGMAACALIAGFYARGQFSPRIAAVHAHETTSDALFQALKVYAFIAGLVLISEAFAPLAVKYTSRLNPATLFWANTLSAVVDNATLVALEVRGMDASRARDAIISLLVAGGMLIPGNIPNIICAGQLGIGSGEWARVGLPLGLVMMGSYFAVLLYCG